MSDLILRRPASSVYLTNRTTDVQTTAPVGTAAAAGTVAGATTATVPRVATRGGGKEEGPTVLRCPKITLRRPALLCAVVLKRFTFSEHRTKTTHVPWQLVCQWSFIAGLCVIITRGIIT